MSKLFDLQTEIQDLEQVLEQTVDENTELRALVEQLQAELQALAWKHAALVADCNNRFRVRHIVMD